jgi:hypothetical protein
MYAQGMARVLPSIAKRPIGSLFLDFPSPKSDNASLLVAPQYTISVITACFMDVERGVKIDRSTIAKFMKADGTSRRTLRVVPDRRSEDLREDYRRRITRSLVDELVL